MEEVTLVAKLTPNRVSSMIKKLNKVKKYVEENHNIRLNLVVVCNDDSIDIIYVGDNVVYINSDLKVYEIIDMIVESIGIKSLILNDKAAAGLIEM